MCVCVCVCVIMIIILIGQLPRCSSAPTTSSVASSCASKELLLRIGAHKAEPGSDPGTLGIGDCRGLLKLGDPHVPKSP